MYTYRRRSRQPGTWLTAALVICGVVVAALLYQKTQQPAPAATVVAAATHTASPVPPAATPIPGEPFRWIVSEKAGLSTRIVWLPYGTTENWDVSILGQDAGHLEGTADLRQGGNYVLAGHVEMADGRPGPFAWLERLEVGDLISILGGGTGAPEALHYLVTEVRVVPPDDISVLRNHGYEELTLITCKDWSEREGVYYTRVIVHARPAEDVPHLRPAGDNP